MAQVDYISSMGIGVLTKFHKKLKDVGGRLRVVNPHENVLDVLKRAYVANMLVASEEVPREAVSDVQRHCWERRGIAFESHGKPDGRYLEGRLQGHPEKFATGQLSTMP